MRRLLGSAALAFAVSVSQAHDDGLAAQPTTSEACSAAKALGHRFDAGLDPGGHGGHAAALTSLLDTDVLTQSLEIELIPGAAAPAPTLIGMNTMTVRCVANELSQFEFVLAPSMTIQEALLDNTTALSVESFGTYGRRVTFPAPLHAGDEFTLKVRYSGRPTGLLVVVSLAGSYSFSEPYYSALWWPTKDCDVGERGDNSDKSLVQMSITAPASLLAISNGVRQSVEALPGNRRLTRWASAYPIAPYLVFFGAFPYTESVLNYSYPLPDGGAGTMPVYFGGHAATPEIVTMLTRFRPLFGEYPFVKEKYGVYKWNWSGGMEHQTYTAQDTMSSRSLNAHELAHQWWGDNVTCKFWNDIWLNEGFARYGEWLFDEYSSGQSNHTKYLASIRANKPSTTLTSSVYVQPPLTNERIFNSASTYGKGAWVLHMLRGVLGDDLFFATLQAYRAMYEGSAATTDDFQAVCEAMSGLNLDSFFDHYVYGIEVPKYALATRITPINGKWLLEYTIRQAQPANVGLFSLPIEMSITGLANRKMWVTGDKHKFTARVTTGTPVVSLDPNDWVLKEATISEPFTGNYPSVVVDASPQPGTLLAHRFDQTSVVLYLSEEPDLSQSTFRLERQETGVAYPANASYDSASRGLRFTVMGALPPGHYLLTISNMPGAQTGLPLDGEVADPEDPASLPSGDGNAGGSYGYAFVVKPIAGCPIDLNGDSVLTFEDFDTFIEAFESGSITADFNTDGELTFEDFDAFVAAFSAGCGTVEPF